MEHAEKVRNLLKKEIEELETTAQVWSELSVPNFFIEEENPKINELEIAAQYLSELLMSNFVIEEENPQIKKKLNYKIIQKQLEISTIHIDKLAKAYLELSWHSENKDKTRYLINALILNSNVKLNESRLIINEKNDIEWNGKKDPDKLQQYRLESEPIRNEIKKFEAQNPGGILEIVEVYSVTNTEIAEMLEEKIEKLTKETQYWLNLSINSKGREPAHITKKQFEITEVFFGKLAEAYLELSFHLKNDDVNKGHYLVFALKLDNDVTLDYSTELIYEQGSIKFEKDKSSINEYLDFFVNPQRNEGKNRLKAPSVKKYQ